MKKAILVFAMTAIVIACNDNAEKRESTDTLPVTTMDHSGDTVTTSDTAGSTGINDIDREFILKAGMGNTAEIEAGRLAVDKGENKDIKEFGVMMIKDHGDAQGKLKDIAGSASVNAPDSVDQEHKSMKNKLSGLSGKAFDKEYIAGQVKDHQATVALFEKQISSGSNARLKEFATSTLPHIKMHLEKAQTIQAALK